MPAFIFLMKLVNQAGEKEDGFYGFIEIIDMLGLASKI